LQTVLPFVRSKIETLSIDSVQRSRIVDTIILKKVSKRARRTRVTDGTRPRQTPPNPTDPLPSQLPHRQLWGSARRLAAAADGTHWASDFYGSQPTYPPVARSSQRSRRRQRNTRGEMYAPHPQGEAAAGWVTVEEWSGSSASMLSRTAVLTASASSLTSRRCPPLPSASFRVSIPWPVV